MLEHLFALQGMERYKAILETSLKEIDQNCKQVKKCGVCPLAIEYVDVNEIPRLLCVDIATDRRIRNCLAEGGKFVTKGKSL